MGRFTARPSARGLFLLPCFGACRQVQAGAGAGVWRPRGLAHARLTPSRLQVSAPPPSWKPSRPCTQNGSSAATSSSRTTTPISQRVTCSWQNQDLTPLGVSLRGFACEQWPARRVPFGAWGSQQPSVPTAICQEPSLAVDDPTLACHSFRPPGGAGHPMPGDGHSQQLLTRSRQDTIGLESPGSSPFLLFPAQAQWC